MCARRLLLVASALCAATASMWGCASASAAGVITANDLATLRDLAALSISPDQQWAAFQTRRADPRANAFAQAWVIVATHGGPARRLADGGDPLQVPINGFILPPAPVWSPDSQWIAYLRKDESRTQVWRARADGKRSEQLTHNAGDADALVYARDGRRLLFQVEPSQAQIGAVLAAKGRRDSSSTSAFPLPTAQHPCRSRVLVSGPRATRSPRAVRTRNTRFGSMTSPADASGRRTKRNAPSLQR